jgi:hypothetical protein
MLIKLINSHYYFELDYDRWRSVKWTKIPFFIHCLDRCLTGACFCSYFLCPLGSLGWLTCHSHTCENRLLVNLRRERTNRFITLDLWLKLLVWPIAFHPDNIRPEHSWVMFSSKRWEPPLLEYFSRVIRTIFVDSHPGCCGFAKLCNLPRAAHHSTPRIVVRVSISHHVYILHRTHALTL